LPKRTDISSILIIGAGPIVIGQAAEFDYSGSQAVKALKEEGYRVIVINSNPATIMTDPEMADATYIEPVTPEVVAKIIEQEKPDALLPTMGGQTGLNTAMALHKDGTLERLGVELIGANAAAIEMAEDRQKFRDAMDRIGLESPKSAIVHSVEEAVAALESIGLPVVIRPSFTLGGTGGGIAYNREEFEGIVRAGLEASPTTEVLIDQSLVGWKEFEMEVVRDGGGPRQGGQCHHHLLDREYRPDGGAHRRFDHRRPGADPDRQGISAHAHRGDRRSARNRR
jgi:carbamoyl-phosphate synthase large subunit